ncbi:hypothetical protein [Ensifer sp. SL37]|uniref:hypothetical protein n=1 Tax=Ensifer sp. SL37 TaxID=2995137 RepID=UPI002273791E|nr:hypothetical protein [Ensifer sp. SL37]MCY1740557.1 hypothetical protein [Ensifer sp. SL37]
MTPTVDHGSADDPDFRANASCNAINRLIRCLFAEGLIDPAGLQWAADGHHARLPLLPSNRVLYFSDLYRAPAGTFQNRGPVEVLDDDGTLKPIEDPAQLMGAVASSLTIAPTSEGLELLLRDESWLGLSEQFRAFC